MYKKNRLFFLSFIIIHFVALAQSKKNITIHSHNDYEQNIPFWNAFNNDLNSIEVDVFLKDDILYVCHEPNKIKKERTLESLYLLPLEQAIDLQLGHLYNFQLLIDIKSEANTTLDKIVKLLQKHPKLIQNKNITFVISGNQPEVEKYNSYPEYIKFDYQKENQLTAKQWEKVALISSNFKKTSDWSGKGKLPIEECNLVQNIVNKAHSHGKPFRFWGTPDYKRAWKTFIDLGVDIINTDLPYESSKYIRSLSERVFHNTQVSEIYTPTFASDKKNTEVKNVILLIGDGNGLSQISSAVLANGGKLTLTQLQSIGFIKTQSSDDFTTDSAAGATAFSTGQKTYNRAIGLDANQNFIPNITEFLSKKGFNTGCITTDEIIGATPAAFYAHQKDRGMDNEIAADLLKSNLSLFVGGGGKYFDKNALEKVFTLPQKVDDIANVTSQRIGFFLAEGGVNGVINGREDVLAKATKNGLAFLQNKNKPFFIMVEGAQIDSYGHHNNVGGIVSEGIDFDKAITEAIKFADATANTLVIITADHETSGFSIPDGNLKDKVIEGDFTSFDHTATMIPVFAYGPQSQLFTGVYENNEIYSKIIKALGIDKTN
ncbi:alkaline phosphatase [Flavobacterium polysaccharolyticum]|uniref:Alkaline phosphatase n=1 Tax=Flavobacterium polysaccharolyticum TaxID=3133148 RepID=A0ABU9NSB5_9FLAO